MLENQLPMFVLNKVYGLTRSSTCEAEKNLDLKELAVQYFEPMIYKDFDPPKTSALCVEEDGEKHFVELFRASICPTRVPKSKFLVKEPHMFRSIRELKESGVKIKKAENCQQRYAAYAWCKELAGAVDDSYLKDVLWKINCYCNDGWNQKKAKLKHGYFYNIWVSLSTMAAILMIYLTMFQTVTGLGDESARARMFGVGFWATFAEAFVIPLRLFKPSFVPAKDELRISLAP
ncbi:hypothetical protein R6Q57_000741 [Mikania cordata]